MAPEWLFYNGASWVSADGPGSCRASWVQIVQRRKVKELSQAGVVFTLGHSIRARVLVLLRVQQLRLCYFSLRDLLSI